MKPTDEQQAITHATVSSERNLLIEALAGTGKTTVLRQVIRAFKDAFPNSTIRYLVFNKRNEQEFLTYPESKLPGVSAKTINACGCEVSKPYVRYAQTKSGYKTGDILKAKFLQTGMKEAQAEPLSFKLMHRYESAFSILKNNLVHNPEDLTDEVFDRLSDLYDFYYPSFEELERLDINPKIFFLDCYNETHFTKTFDFTDQYYRPVRFGWELEEKFDLVLVDEVQDQSLANIEFIRTLGKRFIFCGDKNQCIYGFKGANPDNIKYLEETFDCLAFPLTINWRCSQAVILAAQEFTPLIKASPFASAGEVSTITRAEFEKLTRPGDLVLCRTNAPCLEFAINLMLEGKKVAIYGREFADGMQRAFKDISKNVSMSLTSFENTTKAYYNSRLRRAKSKKAKMELEDQFSAFLTLIASQKDFFSVKNLLTSLFKRDLEDSLSESKYTVSFSSIHRSKGLEFPNVFLIRPDQLPHPFVNPANKFQFQQEINLEYVAITRTQQNFYYVEGK